VIDSFVSVQIRILHRPVCLKSTSTGEAVAIAMPMTVDSVVAYLGIVLAGAVVVSIADSFSPQEMSMRLRISKTRLIITQVKSL
jgi:acyl-coenzyme A synthetase/AMP-(fatty) acid ligase